MFRSSFCLCWFFPPVQSIAEHWSPQLWLKNYLFLLTILSILVSYILKLCFGVHTHLGWCLPIELTLLHYEESSFISGNAFGFEVCLVILTAIPAFCLLFAKYIFFICSLVTHLYSYWKWVSCKHCIHVCVFILFLPSDNLYLVTGVFSPIIFHVITDVIGLRPKVLFFIFYTSLFFFPLFYFPALFLEYLNMFL